MPRQINCRFIASTALLLVCCAYPGGGVHAVTYLCFILVSRQFPPHFNNDQPSVFRFCAAIISCRLSSCSTASLKPPRMKSHGWSTPCQRIHRAAAGRHCPLSRKMPMISTLRLRKSTSGLWWESLRARSWTWIAQNVVNSNFVSCALSRS